MTLELADKIREVVRTMERPDSLHPGRGYIGLGGWRVLAKAEGSMKLKSKRARDDGVTPAVVDSAHLGHNCEVRQQQRAVVLHVQQLRMVPHSQSRSCSMALFGLMRVGFPGLESLDEVADRADYGSRAASMCDTV
jgi:hypothetical protein